MEVKFNKSNNNPFYGLRNCLLLFQNVGGTITEGMLNNCWNEVKDNKEHRQMFFSLLFSIGDITARQHNIFKGVKKDSGGNANRQGFYVVFDWLKNNHKEQFIKFLNSGLFNEYTCFELLFRSRVQTKGNEVIKVYDIFADKWYREKLAEFVYGVINGTNPFNKMLLAKFLTLPRLSKRAGHKQMLPDTKEVMEHKTLFLIELSKLMHWEYAVSSTFAVFYGYRDWRKQYNGTLESVLFSTGKIKEFNKEEFIDWLDKLPSQARFRVKNRVLYSKIIGADVETAGLSQKAVMKIAETLKWPNLATWYKEWEKSKEESQKKQRILEEKVRQGQASVEDVEKLKKIKKEAKVNVGATNFNDIYEGICIGNVDSLKVEAFIQNKVNLPYNSLVIIDDSGSMTGAPFNFATFIAAVCLVKNPDDDARNLLGFFNSYSHWHGFINAKAENTPNSILRRKVESTQIKAFVDPKKSFMENYKNIDMFCRAVFQGGGTNISAIPEGLHRMCTASPDVLDALKSYPVWTIISDGEWNNLPSPEASINDFMRKCQQWFGYKPYIVAIDINKYHLKLDINRFSGVDNFMYIPSNPSQIEQFLINFKDMDVFDIYTPLQSIYRSNRYELIRDNTL